MAGSKSSSSATTKRPRTLTSKPAKANKSSLSAEFVGESDDCDEEESGKPSKKDADITNPKAAATNPTAPRPNNLRLEQLKTRKSPSPAPASNVANGSGTMKDGQDYTTADENSNANSSSRDSNPSPVRPATSAPIQATQAKPLKPPVPNSIVSDNLRPPDAHPKKYTVVDSASEEDSESGGAGSSEDRSEDESASSDRTSLQSPRRISPAREYLLQPAQPPYEPPPGFEPASISTHPSSTISEILASSNLAGKQVWHVTVPASIPVATIKEVSAQSIQSGESILSYKGADYGLVPESGAEASNRALLLPSSRRNYYQPSRIPILKILHLQQLVKIPNHAHQSAGIPTSAPKPKTHVKAVRQQPQGLKMRYHPFGASDSSDSDVSGMTANKAPQFRVPDVPVRSTKKRRLSDGVADSTEVSPFNSKKRKARHSIHVEAEDSAMDVDSPLKGQLEEIGRSSVGSSMDVRATAVNGVKSSKEKKRKKDDKRHKDQNTPKASHSILPTDLRKEVETLIPQEVVKIDAGIHRNSHQEDAKAAKAQRKEEKRKREEMEKATPTKAAGKPLAKPSEPIQQEPSSQSREQSVHIPTPRHSSQQKTGDSQPMLQTSSQSTLHKETKEEIAKRKEEKKNRKVAFDFY